MELTYTAIFEPVPEGEGGGYVAYAAELPGAITEGDTLEEARENLRDAICEVLAAQRDLAGQKDPGSRVIREQIKITAA